MDLKVSLEFCCCGCDSFVHVTVQCKGEGLAGPAGQSVAINVPCPTCGQVNQLFFEPSGTVRSVRPHPGARLWLEPSLN